MTDVLPLPFSGAAMDHAETNRTPEQLKERVDDPTSRAIIFVGGMPAVGPDDRLILVPPTALIGRNLIEPGPIYLGEHDGQSFFAAGLDEGGDLAEAEQFQHMRSVAGRLPFDELAIAGRAKSMLDWHSDHRFCAKCGEKSQTAQGGIFRFCNSCQTHHFPRVNPVAIMMVVHEDHCLLGRGPGWPEGAFSALAGFISPGESLEEGCIREVYEEVGLKVDNVKYLMSQPWPFPSQLMMGLTCQAYDRDITINKKELQDARWFSKETVAAVYAKQSDAFLRPPRMAVAHHLIKYWLDN